MGKCCSKNKIDLPSETISMSRPLEPQYSAKPNHNSFNPSVGKLQAMLIKKEPTHQSNLSKEDDIPPQQVEHGKHPTRPFGYSLENCFQINNVVENQNDIKQEQMKNSQLKSSEKVNKNEKGSFRPKDHTVYQKPEEKKGIRDHTVISEQARIIGHLEEIQFNINVPREEKTFQYITDKFNKKEIQGYNQRIKTFVPLEKVKDIMGKFNERFIIQTQVESDIKQLTSEIEQSMTEEQLKIPMTLTENILVLQTYSTLLTRLVPFSKRAFDYENNDCQSDKYIFSFFYQIKVSIQTLEKASGEDLILKCSHIINVSRGLIDPALRVLELLPYFRILPVWLDRKREINSEEIDLTYRFFTANILYSRTFQEGLKKVLRFYYNNLNHLDNYVKTYESMEIQLAISYDWYGMVGIENRIYIDIKIFQSQSFQYSRQAALIFLYIHEGFHLAYRKCENNFLSIAPECKTDEKTVLFEGGSRIEYYVYGFPNINPYDEKNAMIILDKENWKSGEPLFNDVIDPAKLPCLNFFMSGMFKGFPRRFHPMQKMGLVNVSSQSYQIIKLNEQDSFIVISNRDFFVVLIINIL